MAKLTKTFRTGSKNWQAFFDGKLSGKELFEQEYRGPIAKEVQDEMVATGQYVDGLLEDTVIGWSNPPTFIADVRGRITDPGDAKVELVFFATGENAKRWTWIDQGTAVHDIPQANRNALRPMPVRGYSPRTSPGAGLPKSTGSGAHGSPKGYARKIRQSIRARHFTERITEHMQRDGTNGFAARITKAVKRAITRLK